MREPLPGGLAEVRTARNLHRKSMQVFRMERWGQAEFILLITNETDTKAAMAGFDACACLWRVGQSLYCG
jgi:hypothetical protein